MLKKISNGTVSLGKSGSTVDSPEHDFLSWLAPPGQLEGPNRDCTRSLRAVMTKAVEKYANQIDYAAHGWSGNRRAVKMDLKKALRTRCNRRRTSDRLLAYRTLGVYMESGFRPESTDARNGVVRCMRDELQDLKAGDVNLSDEEPD